MTRRQARGGPGGLPAEAFDRQVDLLVEVRRGVAALSVAVSGLKVQARRLATRADRLYDEARVSLGSGREDVARATLEERAGLRAAAAELDGEIAALEARRETLVLGERSLSGRLGALRRTTDELREGDEAARALVEIREAAAGLADEVSAATLAIGRAAAKRAELARRPDASERHEGSGEAESELAALRSAARG